jgi:hypothetical protein
MYYYFNLELQSYVSEIVMIWSIFNITGTKLTFSKFMLQDTPVAEPKGARLLMLKAGVHKFSENLVGASKL